MFLCAGDPSGDIHASALVRALREREPDIRISGMGGPAMEQAGCLLLRRLTDHAVMGFSRVVGALPTFIGLLRDAARFLEQERPDACVLIDFPGFNMNLAALAKHRSVPVIYYICPQLWAWASWRLRRFARRVDKALVIFPFEEDFFGEAGIETRWVGHPAADAVAEAVARMNVGESEDPARQDGAARREGICLLPGSRIQEIRANLPVMLEVVSRLREQSPELGVTCAHLDESKRELIGEITGNTPVSGEPPGSLAGTPPRIVADYHESIRRARLVLVASGTATLEVALLGAPMVVIYRITPFLRWASRRLLTVPHIAQVNLLAGRRIVPEFLTSGGDIDRIAEASRALLTDGPDRSRCLADLETLAHNMARPGAAGRAADAVLEMVNGARIIRAS